MNNQDVIRLISWRVSAMIMPTIGLRAAWSRFCLVSNVLDIMCSVVLKKGLSGITYRLRWREPPGGGAVRVAASAAPSWALRERLAESR